MFNIFSWGLQYNHNNTVSKVENFIVFCKHEKISLSLQWILSVESDNNEFGNMLKKVSIDKIFVKRIINF